MRRLLLSLFATIIAGIPLWVYLIANMLLAPQGFWQNFFLFGIGIWLLGGTQVLLFFIWIAVLITIWEK
jgi:hypothetical protein